MKDQLGQSFGLVIAFLIPGMIGVYAASFHVALISAWFGTAASQTTNVGGFLFAILASIGMGVFISGLRWLVLERWMRWEPEQAVNAAARRDDNTELVYQNLVYQFYDFYLFYANTLFALVILYVAWFADAPRTFSMGTLTRTGLLVVACAILYVSAKDSLRRFEGRRKTVLGLVQPQRESA